MPDIVGLTIQQRSLRGVEAKVSRSGRCTVLRTSEVPFAESVFDGGRLVDQAAFTQSLTALWEEGNFKSKRVQLVIDGRLAVIRRTELPSLGEAQLRKAASYDIAELLSYPISEAVFDVDEIEQFDRSGTTWAKALVVAVQESTLLELGAAVAGAGLHLVGTDLAAEALARGVDFEAADAGTDGESASPDDTSGSNGQLPNLPIAILDCEDATTNIVIRDRSGVLFARTLGVGVGESTISVADELESALAQLSGDDGDQLGSSGSTSAGVSNVVESIRRTLSYYTAELDDRPIRGVSIAGARGQAPGLLAALEDTLGVPSRPALPVAEWPNDMTVHGFETPIGAAIGAVTSKTRHLALTSDRERAARSKRRNRVAALASGIPTAALLVASGLTVRADVSAARASAEQGEVTTQALALRLSELDGTSQRIAEWQAAVREIESIEQQQVRMDLVIRQLAANMPLDSRILSVDLQRGSIGDVPTGYVGPTPVGIISITGIADDLDGVSRWLAGASSSDVIDGLWLEQSTYGPIGANGELGALFSVKGVITAAARPAESMISTELFTNDPEQPGGVEVSIEPEDEG